MKKVLFLMFLLLLCLVTVNVKAQVRIGGNVAPNPAVVLDLNTNNNANPAGNKGLGLPRVSLANDTTLLTPGVANLNGMMVCNTTNTLGGVGLYYWSANSAKWVMVNLPPTSAADSGRFLMSNGSSFAWKSPLAGSTLDTTSVQPIVPGIPLQLTLILDTTVNVSYLPNTNTEITAIGLKREDICYQASQFNPTVRIIPLLNRLWMANISPYRGVLQQHIRCLRPSA